MPKHKGNGDDPIRRFMEAQDHRYDPGYFTGGNMDPLLTGRRPNKYGYWLIIAGSFILLIHVAFLLRGEAFWQPLDFRKLTWPTSAFSFGPSYTSA